VTASTAPNEPKQPPPNAKPIDLTDEQLPQIASGALPIEERPFDPSPDRERVRGTIAKWLIVLLVAVIAALLGGEFARRLRSTNWNGSPPSSSLRSLACSEPFWASTTAINHATAQADIEPPATHLHWKFGEEEPPC
jgi:hypothetical protein